MSRAFARPRENSIPPTSSPAPSLRLLDSYGCSLGSALEMSELACVWRTPQRDGNVDCAVPAVFVVPARRRATRRDSADSQRRNRCYQRSTADGPKERRDGRSCLDALPDKMTPAPSALRTQRRVHSDSRLSSLEDNSSSQAVTPEMTDCRKPCLVRPVARHSATTPVRRHDLQT